MSNGALRREDTLTGMHIYRYYDGEEEYTINVNFNGYVDSGSYNVNINGKPAARQGDNTKEFDSYCNGTGIITSGSGSVFINGKPAARRKDSLSPHKGNASFTSSSNNVIIND